jgi:hypothetical protein
MMRKKTVLVYFILILISAGLFAYGVLSRCAGSTAEPNEAQKLAELEAALVEAAATDKASRLESNKVKQAVTPRTSRTRST